MKFKDHEEIEGIYKAWFNEMKKKLSGQGPYFLGNKVPFITNPDFKPKPIISNSIRAQVYNLHKKDPEYWSTLRLSAKFSINAARIESIICQKSYEETIKLSDSNREFVEKMESHILTARQSIQIRDSNTVVKELEPRPLLVAVPENYNLTLQVRVIYLFQGQTEYCWS